MSRSSSYNPPVNINFQTDTRTRDAIHAEARRQDRSASAEIRLAIRAWLSRGQATSSAMAQQPALTSAPAPSTLSRTERPAAAGEGLCLNTAAEGGSAPEREGAGPRPDPHD
jgi:hypothetical protein